MAGLHARDDMRVQRTFCVVGEGIVKGEGVMSSISDAMAIPACFFALNCAQSIDFCRFWWFFVTFAPQMRAKMHPHPAFGHLLPEGEGFTTRT
ncbi:MAG: hypothetical protein WEB58_12715 [Planctomycetaceae bacterium]